MKHILETVPVRGHVQISPKFAQKKIVPYAAFEQVSLV